MFKKRAWNIFVATSILLSAVFFGTYKKTLSASLGEIEHKNIYARLICDGLEIILSDPNHCINEYHDYSQEVNK